jgi:glycosyltransferase involved in cell wall biosynthesis
MQIALIADTFPPLRTSGAIQLRDLSREIAKNGHSIFVLVSSPELKKNWQIDKYENIHIVRLKTFQTKDVGYFRRTFAELIMPFVMFLNYQKTLLKYKKWDGIIWYSPSIFLGPIVWLLKKKSGCKSYLIIRDIFPEWAYDMGLMRKGLKFLFFKLIANYQNSVADIIGIQTEGNRIYFKDWLKKPKRKIEVLNNWLSPPNKITSSTLISKTAIAKRKIFIYAGNMGVAQDMSIIMNLVCSVKNRKDIGFIFIGRGSALEKLKQDTKKNKLNNIIFHDEIDSDEIFALYKQCVAGIVSLDDRHKSHNIPGKFISYMHAGLPVFAVVNENNDLIKLINKEKVGKALSNRNIPFLKRKMELFIENDLDDNKIKVRCKNLAKQMFSTEQAAKQILSSFN